MTPQEMLDILEGRQEATAKAALETLRSHPTCVLPAAMCLRDGAPDASADERRTLTRAVALGCADRIAMSDLADLSGLDWASIYPQVGAPAQKSTQDTIDLFIETYGHSSAKEDALLEKLIFNPVAPDYFSDTDVPFDPSDPLALPPELAAGSKQPKPEPKAESIASAAEEKATAEAEIRTPEAEAEAKAEAPKASAEKAAEGHEEPSLMESLAKIYIKQRRYARALEIINNLSLKYPEKSVYFADQIRFLRKLVNNQRRWEASKQG